MNIEQETYFGNYRLLFRMDGWKQFLEDIEVSMEDITKSIMNEDDYGKIMKLKGQHKQLEYFLNFETQMINFERQLEDDAQEFDDDL